MIIFNLSYLYSKFIFSKFEILQSKEFMLFSKVFKLIYLLFIKFTKNLWINEVTNEDTGTIFYHYLKEVLELDNTYFDTKNKFDVLYKEMNIEKNIKNNVFIALLLFVSFVVNTINIIYLLKK